MASRRCNLSRFRHVLNGLHHRLQTAAHLLRTRGACSLALALLNRSCLLRSNPLIRAWSRPGFRRLSERFSSCPACIYIGTGDLTNPLLQRYQHMARELSRLVPLVYVSPRQGFDSFIGLRQMGENLYLADALAMVLEALPLATVILQSVDHRLPQIMKMLHGHSGRIVYEYIDLLDQTVDRLPITDNRRKAHTLLLEDPSVLVVATARALLKDAARHRSSGLTLITNGVDPAHFRVRPSLDGLSPAYLHLLDDGRPILGYFGALAEWIDYPLLEMLARRRPDVNIVLIGPDYDGSMSRVISSFPGNLYVHPRVEYDMLPHYAAHFDACLLPFRINPVTTATSPLKLFEYMALGLPILSTNIPEASEYDSPLVAKSSDEFVSLVDTALHRRNDSRFLKLLAAEADANSWCNKAADLARFCGLAGKE